MGCGPSKDASTAVVEAKPQATPNSAQLKKAEDEQKRLERIGQSAEPLPDFTPNAGFVIKTKRTNTFQKAFVNVFHHDSVPTTTRFVTRDEQWKVDRKGENCCVFTCVIPSSVYAAMLKDPMSQPTICVQIITLINDLYPLAKLDLEYVLPKIHSGYMGEAIDFISSDPNAPKYATSTAPVVAKKTELAAAPKPAPVTAPALLNPHLTLVKLLFVPMLTLPGLIVLFIPTYRLVLQQKSQAAEKAHLIHAPPKMQGWLKKKGHIVINWKTR